MQGVYRHCLLGKLLVTLVRIRRKGKGSISWRSREKRAELDGFPYGLSVENFLPKPLPIVPYPEIDRWGSKVH